MRVVTIGALHEALINAMVRGHIELATNIGMARITGFVLLFHEQKLGRGRMMNRVATGARDAVESVLGALNVRLTQILHMACQAILQHRARLHDRECMGDRRLAAACSHMRLRGTVTALAARALGRQIPHSNALEVRILVEVTPDIGMTGLADVTSEVMVYLRGRGGRRRLCRGLRPSSGSKYQR